MEAMKRIVSVTTGTRADYGLLRPILREILSSKTLKLRLIVTGMHISKKYGFTMRQITNDGFKIAAKVPMMPPTDSKYDVSYSLGTAISKFSKVFKKLRPDVNLILGDRDEMLASAIAAYHMNIPNAHIHGGDRSGGLDEYTRHAITKMSNIHFPATKESKNRIIKMGENPKYVFLAGSPAMDEVVQNKISSKKYLESTYKIDLAGDEIILLYHPVTTQIKKTKKQISNLLDAIAKLGNATIAILPNSDAGNRTIFSTIEQYSKRYRFIKKYPSFPREDFLGLLKYCGVLVGNSSSGMVEASYFDIPVINIGIRQKGRERGKNVCDVSGDSIMSIYDAIDVALKSQKKVVTKNKLLYGRGVSSKKIVSQLEKINLDDNLIQKRSWY